MYVRKRIFISIFFLFVIILGLVGHVPVTKAGGMRIMDSSQEPDGKVLSAVSGATITGRVIDQNGQGIGGAQVLSDNGAPNYSGVKSTLSSQDGMFTLTDVQSGPNHLVASLNGLASSHYWNFDITDEQNYTNINFILRPGGGWISGRVTNENGQGVDNASVNILENTAQGYNNGAWAYTTTDANGYFSTDPGIAYGLPTGSYLVMAEKEVSTRQDNVYVSAGEGTLNVNLNFRIGGGTIEGRVVDKATNLPIGGADVLADNSLMQSAGVSDSNGFYTISGLGSGGYNVVVMKPEYANTHSYNILVADGFKTSGVDFSMTTEFGQISGRITNVDGEPLAGVDLLADSNEGSGFGNAVTDNNGYYLIHNLSPMTYVIHASHPNYSNVYTIADVQEGEITSNVNIIMGVANGGISGRITKDGQAAPFAGIYVNSSAGSEMSSDGSALSDGNGYYEISNLPPGLYDVHVADVPGYTNQVRYFVEVGAGIKTGVNFNLTNGYGSVEGYVTDLNGNNLEGVKVQLFQLSNPGTWIAVTTDNNGYYSASGLWIGDYNLYADQAEFPTTMKSYISISGDNPARVDIVLGQDRSLVANPSDLYITVVENSGMDEDVMVDVSSGEATVWTAESNAEWLLLGNSGEIYEDSGRTGLDGLILRFDPSKVEYGRYSTDVLLTAPDAGKSIIRVTMSKIDPDSLNLIYLPLVGAGN